MLGSKLFVTVPGFTPGIDCGFVFAMSVRDMFPEAVRAIRELRPRAFTFENVKGLLRESFSNYFEYIHLQLTYPGFIRRSTESWKEHRVRLEKHHTSRQQRSEYNVIFRLLNAADFGVPQRRGGFRMVSGKRTAACMGCPI